MTQYCTLQEAYNVDSFSRKKKNTGCATPNASATPYNPFTEQQGREQARVMESFQSAMSGLRGTGSQEAMGDTERLTYKGKKTDYDYYCKNFNICALEGFDVSTGKPTKIITPPEKCELKSNPYQYPISEEDKAKFQRALNEALEQAEGSTPPTPLVTPRKIMPDKITGYQDDELDNYLSIRDMKAAPKEMPSAKMPVTKKETTVEPMENDKNKPINYTQKYGIWMDLLLFISSGLLFIFLLEQMYKLALMKGIKETILTMEKIIQNST